MDISFFIFLSIVAFFIFRGYRSGLLSIVTRLLSLVAAYLAAYLFAQSFGLWLQTVSPLEGLISYAIGGIVIFVLTSTLLSLFSSLMIKLFTKEAGVISRLSSVSGALVGGVFGVIIGLLFVWFYSSMQTLYQVKKNQPVKAPTEFEQTAKKLTGEAIKTIVAGMTNQTDIATATASILVDPAESIRKIRELTESGVVQSFFNNQSAQSALNSRNAKAVMLHPEFQKLVNHPDFIALIKPFGFSDKPDEMQKQVAVKITTIWAQINQVKQSAEYQQIVDSAELQQMFKSKDIYSMLNSKKVEQLFQLISSAKIPRIVFMDPDKSVNNALQAVKQSKIYRWVDKKGRVHYTDKEKDKN